MKRIIAASLLIVVVALAGLKRDALKYVPRDWIADTAGAVTRDFNSDGSQDIALVYYQIDQPAGEFNNRINRVLVLMADGRKLRPVIDQFLPYEEDFGTEVTLDYRNDLLLIFQHMGFMHRWNEWGLAYDAELDMFWEASHASGGILGLGFAASVDFRDGTGYVEKVWDDVDITAHYATIYSNQTRSPIDIDGKDAESDWLHHTLPITTHNWITYGEDSWNGFDDATFNVRSLYDDEFCYFYIEVRDDEIINPSSANQILSCDHLELWIDQLTWEKSEETGYYPQMWDRRKDPYVAQFAIAQIEGGNPVAVQWLPSEKGEVAGIKMGVIRDAEVCNYEVAIPWRFFGESSDDLEYAPMTVVYSDTDDRTSPEQESLIATSEARWADPFTFGYWQRGRHVRYYWGVSGLEENQ